MPQSTARSSGWARTESTSTTRTSTIPIRRSPTRFAPSTRWCGPARFAHRGVELQRGAAGRGAGDLEREGLASYVALQPNYNLVHRGDYEGPLRDVCVREGLACVPYFALASGFLTGRYRPGATVDSARRTSSASIGRRRTSACSGARSSGPCAQHDDVRGGAGVASRRRDDPGADCQRSHAGAARRAAAVR